MPPTAYTITEYPSLNGVKQPLVSLKMPLSSATNGLPNEMKRSFRYSTLLILPGIESKLLEVALFFSNFRGHHWR